MFSSIYKELQYIFIEGAPPSTSDRKYRSLITKGGKERKKSKKLVKSYMLPSQHVMNSVTPSIHSNHVCTVSRMEQEFGRKLCFYAVG